MKDEEQSKEACEEFEHVLQLLWESIVSPIVRKLQELSNSQGSRIWWWTTSFVCMFPLYAAGPYKTGQHNLSDLYLIVLMLHVK